jgi:septum formation protein
VTARVPLVLASASPARLATLRSAGIEPLVIVSGVDESQVSGLPPAELALQLAELKCAAVAARDDVPPDALVLGCDSVLELQPPPGSDGPGSGGPGSGGPGSGGHGEALGKPGDAAEARERWRAMRGRSAVLHSGHSLREVSSGRVVAATGSTLVHFADVSDDEVEAYVATGEPLHVAGAFTIDGFGGAFVRGIEGDHHNVVGVSLPLLRELVLELGHAWPDLWT